MSRLQSAAVLVLDSRKRILCVTNRIYGGWGTPGGKVESGEAVVAAAVRELREEANVVAEPDDLELLWTHPWRFVRADGVLGEERDNHLYYAKRVAGEPRALESGMSLEWMYYAKLYECSAFSEFYNVALKGGSSILRLDPTRGVR